MDLNTPLNQLFGQSPTVGDLVNFMKDYFLPVFLDKQEAINNAPAREYYLGNPIYAEKAIHLDGDLVVEWAGEGIVIVKDDHTIGIAEI